MACFWCLANVGFVWTTGGCGGTGGVLWDTATGPFDELF